MQQLNVAKMVFWKQFLSWLSTADDQDLDTLEGCLSCTCSQARVPIDRALFSQGANLPLTLRESLANPPIRSISMDTRINCNSHALRVIAQN